MTTDFPIDTVMAILDRTYPYHPMADVTERDPFKVLICCLLSIRSRDVVTMPVCSRLFLAADTPRKILDTPPEVLAALIEPVQFYRQKVDIIRSVSREILDRFDGRVPDTVEALETIKGVGRKTANLVVQMGFQKPAIAVDTHVHRVSNRLGYVTTRTPEQTEQVLREQLPPRYWNTINRVLVRHGQEICIAGRPRCDVCPVERYCRKVGVIPRRSRTAKPAVHAIFHPPGSGE